MSSPAVTAHGPRGAPTSLRDGRPQPLPPGRMEDEASDGSRPMEVHDVIAQARDALTVKRVFGEP